MSKRTDLPQPADREIPLDGRLVRKDTLAFTATHRDVTARNSRPGPAGGAASP